MGEAIGRSGVGLELCGSPCYPHEDETSWALKLIDAADSRNNLMIRDSAVRKVHVDIPSWVDEHDIVVGAYNIDQIDRLKIAVDPLRSLSLQLFDPLLPQDIFVGLLELNPSMRFFARFVDQRALDSLVLLNLQIFVKMPFDIVHVHLVVDILARIRMPAGLQIGAITHRQISVLVKLILEMDLLAGRIALSPEPVRTLLNHPEWLKDVFSEFWEH